jgi:hypothetical protein
MNGLEAALSVAISVLVMLVLALGLALVAVWELRLIIDMWNRRNRS